MDDVYLPLVLLRWETVKFEYFLPTSICRKLLNSQPRQIILSWGFSGLGYKSFLPPSCSLGLTYQRCFSQSVTWALGSPISVCVRRDQAVVASGQGSPLWWGPSLHGQGSVLIRNSTAGFLSETCISLSRGLWIPFDLKELVTIDERTLSQESTYPALAVLFSIACPLFLAIIKNLSAFYKPHLSGSRLSWLKQHINQIQLSTSNCLAVNIKSKTGINIASLVICNDIRIFFFIYLFLFLMCIQSSFFLSRTKGMRMILGGKDWVVLLKTCGESQS